jgi:hypothetical protein
MSDHQFSATIAPLLRHLNTSAPTLNDDQAIRIDFKHLQLQLTPLNQHELLIVASLGALPINVPGTLAWKLLAANDIDPAGPPVCVSVTGAENALILWSRERYLHLNAQEIISLFERMVAKANGLATLISEETRSDCTPTRPLEMATLRTSLVNDRILLGQ